MGDDPTALDAILSLLRRTHLSSAADLAGIVAEEATGFGARRADIYLVDHELSTLVPVPKNTGPDEPLEPLSVTGTMAGRSFSGTTILSAPAEEPGRRRLWVPLLDGTERIGVLGLTFDDEGELPVLLSERYAHLVAMLTVTKGAYSDVFEVLRRRQPMTIASELVQAVAPPLIFATEGLAIAGMLEPAYDNGGDALDYAVNDGVLHAAVFDAMGHGLAAAGVAAFAVAAYRASRRTGRDLLETYAAMDEAVGRQFPDNRFVTAVIAQVDRGEGELRWISAGHPPPLLLRGGRHPRLLEAPPATPLGVEQGEPPVVARQALEPGDLILFYTDGLTEARGPDGELLEVEGLSGFIEREAAAGHSGPETLRRLRQAISASDRAQLRDDATALLLEWRRGSEAAIMPETVL